MPGYIALFVKTFATLLAIINPLEVLLIYIALTEHHDTKVQRAIARNACIYAAGLAFFFLIFGSFILHIFNIPLAMVRVAGGIILTRIGFSLFMPNKSDSDPVHSHGPDITVAFVPLAMPLMVGPGAIATIIGMASTIDDWPGDIISAAVLSAAILTTMFVTFVCLTNARQLKRLLGPLGIDATTRIVGFFLAAIGVGLVFDGAIETLVSHGLAKLS
jgi:multiple antibiotic resistance protein